MNFEKLSAKLEGFNHYYESELKPKLLDLELRRKKASSLLKKATVVVVIIAIVIIISMGSDAPFIFILIGGSIIFGFFKRRVTAVEREAKMNVMPILCEYLGFNYSNEPRINKLKQFENLSIIASHNREYREDEISGQLSEVDFWLQEAKLVKVSGTGKNKTRRTVFKGLLCHFDFHKNFKSTTIGKKDWTAFGNFFTGAFTAGEKVKLEDPEFERKFEIYSTDQVEARYLLTPGFMQRMLDLLGSGHTNSIQFAFDDGKLYMALESSKKFFEGGGHDLNKPEFVFSIINDISLMFEIVKTLNLTQKTKI
ncbi:MAG: DUF3137 domain-containing protein [Emcibacteraceae bacterium]|nr:DUF3137 domain-containing protein [Emcibacteraceae bacterium]